MGKVNKNWNAICSLFLDYFFFRKGIVSDVAPPQFCKDYQMVVLLEEKFNYYRMYNVIAYATLNKSYKTLVAMPIS